MLRPLLFRTSTQAGKRFLCAKPSPVAARFQFLKKYKTELTVAVLISGGLWQVSQYVHAYDLSVKDRIRENEKKEADRIRENEKKEATPKFKYDQAVAVVYSFLEEVKVPKPATESQDLLSESGMSPIPCLIRSDLDVIRKLVVTDGGFVLFVGSSGFGKSTSVQLALSGASPYHGDLEPALYLKLRNYSNFWEDIAKAFGVPYDQGTSPSFIKGSIESALIQRKSEGKRRPTIFLDDIDNVLMASRSPSADARAAENFCGWLREQHKHGLLNGKFMTSNPEVVAVMKEFSGFDRLWVKSLPSVPLVDVKNYLLQNTEMTQGQVERVVDVAGVHMGDVGDLTATFLSKDQDFIEEHFEDCLSRLIKRSEPEMLKVLTGETTDAALPRKDLIKGAHAVFQSFEDSKGAPVDFVAVRKKTSLKPDQFQAVVKALVAAKFLVDVDGRNLRQYTPRQRHTYQAIKEKPIVKDFLDTHS